MKIGFDFGGTLDAHDILRQLSQYLLGIGHEIHIITLCGDGDQVMIRQELEELGLRFTDIHFCIQTSDTTMEEKAKMKLAVMKRYDIPILFEDVQEIVDYLNNKGFLAIKI